MGSGCVCDTCGVEGTYNIMSFFPKTLLSLLRQFFNPIRNSLIKAYEKHLGGNGAS